MGEGLKVDEARDATFLLTGAGKSAYLTANPMTIEEGKRAIAQAVSDNRVKARGLGHPHVNLPTQQPFQFNTQRASQLKDVSGDCSSDYPQTPIIPLEAKNAIGEGETRGINHLAASFPDHFPLECVAELKRDCIYGGLPK